MKKKCKMCGFTGSDGQGQHDCQEVRDARISELESALEWIRDSCGDSASNNICQCGRPTGILGICNHAAQVLIKSTTKEIKN